MSIGTGAGVDAWYKSGGDVIPSRWVQAMEAAQRFYNKPIIFTEPFNEPDYGWVRGTVANLYDILGLLQTSTNFPGTMLSGGSTLNCDLANAWYDPIKTRTTAGTTHALAASFNGYVSFLRMSVASGDKVVIPEAHNLIEVFAALEYGGVVASFGGIAHDASQLPESPSEETRSAIEVVAESCHMNLPDELTRLLSECRPAPRITKISIWEVYGVGLHLLTGPALIGR